MANSKNKIIWALDPFGDNRSAMGRSVQLVKFLAQKEKWKIEPAYVLSPDGFNWTGDFSGSWLKEFKPKVLKAMSKLMSPFVLDDMLLPTKIITNKSLSLSGDVKKLVSYASRSGAGAVVLQTHARKGMSRLLLGSFAETAMLQSRVPLLLINPKSQEISTIKKAFFPTDLSEPSKRAFRKLVPRLKKWGAEVVVYYKLPDPVEPVVQAGVQMAGGGWVSVYQFLEKEYALRKKECDQLVKVATKAGVKASVTVDDQPGFVVDSIMDRASKENADVICMVSKSSSVASILIGSVARQLARQSKIPMWITHSDV